MAMISWGTVKSLLIFFGPMLLPKAIGYYRSIRSAPPTTVQPLPPRALRAIAILFGVALVFALSALPPLAPENIFTLTQSRLQIPTDVLFTRLSSLRPDNALTASDTALRAKFVNLESRLLYLQFGPQVLAECPFCSSDEPRSYFYYALPALLTPHIVSVVAMSVATEGAVGGTAASRWRTTGAIVGTLAVVLDIFITNAYNHQLNSRATRLSDLDLFFWNSRAYRALGLALLDAVLTLLIYLSATNRAFYTPPTPAERVEAVTRRLQATKSRLSAVGIVKNTAIRDEELRARTQAYWQHEGRLMREVMEERDVVEGVNDALANRVNIADISRDAEAYAVNMLPRVPTPPLQQAPETIVG